MLKDPHLLSEKYMILLTPLSEKLYQSRLNKTCSSIVYQIVPFFVLTKHKVSSSMKPDKRCTTDPTSHRLFHPCVMLPHIRNMFVVMDPSIVCDEVFQPRVRYSVVVIIFFWVAMKYHKPLPTGSIIPNPNTLFQSLKGFQCHFH